MDYRGNYMLRLLVMAVRSLAFITINYLVLIKISTNSTFFQHVTKARNPMWARAVVCWSSQFNIGGSPLLRVMQTQQVATSIWGNNVINWHFMRLAHHFCSSTTNPRHGVPNNNFIHQHEIVSNEIQAGWALIISANTTRFSHQLFVWQADHTHIYKTFNMLEKITQKITQKILSHLTAGINVLPTLHIYRVLYEIS